MFIISFYETYFSYLQKSVSNGRLNVCFKGKLDLLNMCKDSLQSTALYDTFSHFSLYNLFPQAAPVLAESY